jgi:hypothetical protein
MTEEEKISLAVRVIFSAAENVTRTDIYEEFEVVSGGEISAVEVEEILRLARGAHLEVRVGG